MIAILTLLSSQILAQNIPGSMGSAGATLNQTKKDPAARQTSQEVGELKDHVEDLVDEIEIPGRNEIKARQQRSRSKAKP